MSAVPSHMEHHRAQQNKSQTISQDSSMVMHNFDPSAWEAEAGGSLWVQGQSGPTYRIPGQTEETETSCERNRQREGGMEGRRGEGKREMG